MIDQTPLDIAHAAMDAAPENDAVRLHFYERLADSELFLLLKSESKGDQITPDLITVEGKEYVLLFDREERLADFVDGSAHHAALSGRVVAMMLAGQGIGLGVNLGVAPSSILIPGQAVEWLVDMLGNTPDETTAQPVSFGPPTELSKTLLSALDSKLATAAGLAAAAYLVKVTYADDRHGYMLAIIDAFPAARGALAKAVNEAVVFSGVQMQPLDVAFFAASDAVCTNLAKVGLRFDLPKDETTRQPPTAPGRDPDNPPIIRSYQTK